MKGYVHYKYKENYLKERIIFKKMSRGWRLVLRDKDGVCPSVLRQRYLWTDGQGR